MGWHGKNQQAQEIIEAWKSGSAIFSEGTDLIKNGISSITGLIAMFIKFAARRQFISDRFMVY